MNKRLGLLQRQSGQFRKRGNLFTLPGVEPRTAYVMPAAIYKGGLEVNI
jgi:endonuclease III